MARMLIVYGTSEGQAAKIAEQIAATVRRAGHDVDVRHVRDVRDAALDGYDAVVVGGSLHMGRYQPGVRDFIARHKALLESRPSAFFSVSLAAASRDPNERTAALRIAREFVAKAGWSPRLVASFAGALKYTQYGFFTRLMMKRIARKEGGSTDTSRDVEYTDWDEVGRFAEQLSHAMTADGG